MIKLLSCAVAFALGVQELHAVNEEGYTSASYVANGLVAQWDGKDFCGRDTPAATRTGGTYNRKHPWYDLIGGRKIEQTYKYYDPTMGPRGANTFGSMYGDYADCLKPSETGITVEIVVNFVAEYEQWSNESLFVGPKSSGVGIMRTERYAGSSSFPNALLLANDGFTDQPQKFFAPAPGAGLAVISVGYTNGCIVADHVFVNGVALEPTTKTFQAPDAVPATADASDGCNGTYHAIRVYNRLLTAAEVTANSKVDACRYAKEYAFTVLSGSVTVDAVTYGVGEKVYVDKGATASVAATDAVLEPRADGQSKISVDSGTVTIRRADSSAICYVKELTLGASVTLNVPAPGLNAGVLTADSSATAAGAGLLIAAAADAPVAGSVTYRSANESWTGWPTTGTTAYVPAGATVTIAAADVSAVEALDTIVFMDDGTDAAAASTVSYSESGALALKASLVGPGVFTATGAGKITISGDSRHFTGNYALANTEALVTHEYGLGSSFSRAARLTIGAAGLVNFDNGADVFTNRAPIYMARATSDVTAKFGSISLDKKLVQKEFFYQYGCQGKFVNNTILEKGFRSDNQSYYPQCITKGGVAEIRGDLDFDTEADEIYPSAGSGTLLYSMNTISWTSFQITGLMKCGNKNVLDPRSGYTGRSSSNVIDLNGYDQALLTLSWLHFDSKPPQDLTVTSAVPATLTIRKAVTTKEMNFRFLGAAGFRVATGANSPNATNRYHTAVCNTTGPLIVESGALKLYNGFYWGGANVTVTGGALVLADTASINKKATLTLDDEKGAKMALPDGGTVKVKRFVRNGKVMSGGLYGGAAALAAGKIDADHCLACFDAASTGVLSVPGGFCILVR